MRKLFIILVCLSAQSAAVQAQTKSVRFEWDADFSYFFDNREFAASSDGYSISETLNAAVLTPSAGISVKTSRDVNHRIRLGLDIYKNMGGGETNLSALRELTLFYDAHVAMDRARFEGLAGCFPRSYMEGEYGEAFFDDKYLFTDRNIEGVLMKYRAERFFTELGCDWMGSKGQTRHERFQIFSSGVWHASEWLDLGWAASFYHYASSIEAPGVVDNHLLNPYLRLDLSRLTGLGELSLKAGGLVSYQRNRRVDDTAYDPYGAQVDLTVRNWCFGLKSSLYTGYDQQVYFHDRDVSGAMYGTDLYFGSPFYQLGVYDRTEIWWQPEITDYLDLKLSCHLHFGNAPDGIWLGNRQVLSLVFDLEKLRRPSCISGRAGHPAARRVTSLRDFLNL